MTNISFRLAALCMLLAVFISGGFAQNTEAQTSATADETQITLSTPESAITFNTADTPSADVPNTPSTIWLFIRMILVLAVVVAAIYGVVFLMKKGFRPRPDDDPFLRKVSQITLSPGKTVQIVTLFNHAYLIGVTDGSINLLGEITDEQFVNSMNLYADQQTQVSKPRSFEDILNIFTMRRSNGQPVNAFGNSAQEAADELKRQRERLNGEEQ
ncbi:MAG: flagellar biosynthetic protein FliO [Treponema sp.]|nr:flagellar biosynthetic protein FliO [Treponema sp.]